jgi:excisionase family DNA binding protein
MKDMLTTREVADRLGVSQARVRALIQSGRLPSQQFGRDHLINESDLKLVEDRKPGRPPKKASKKAV